MVLIIISVENSFCWLLFMYKLWYIFQDLLNHLFETEIVRKIINVFTVTFDQLNASSQNKSINFLCTL